MASAGQPSLSKDAIRRYAIHCFSSGRIYSLNCISFSFRKLVIIGDGACGKTSLLSVFTLGYFPRVFECYLYILTLGLRIAILRDED